MPKKPVDNSAAKARKQKMILAVGGVLLLGLAAFQGPKLMHRGGSPTSAPAPAADTASAAPAPAAAAPAVAPAVVSGRPAAVVAGVALPGAPARQAATNQLISFTLFKAKDPFVQRVGDAQPGSTPPGAAPPAQPAAPAGKAGPTTGEAPKPTAAPAPIAFATISLNGTLEQVETKGAFPEKNPLFVLRSLDKREARIAVAGGSFDDSQTVALPFGRKVTLVNTATGVRYELKLVYTGSTPEVIEGFSTDKQASNGNSSTGATDTTTADSTAGTSSSS